MRTSLSLALLLWAATAAAAAPSVDELLGVGARATLVGDWDRALKALRGAAAKRRDAIEKARLAVEIARVTVERHFYHAEDRAAAVAAADEAVALAEKAGDARVLAAATLQRARVAYREDAFDEATALGRRAHELSTAAGDRAGIGQAELLLGLVEQAQGKLAAARPRFETALAIGIDVGDVDLQSSANRHLGFVLRETDAARALRLFELSLLQRETMGSTVTVPFAVLTVADAAWPDAAQRDTVIARLERAIPIAVRARSTRAEAQARLTLARFLLERGRRGDAMAQARAARAAAARFGNRALVEQVDALLRNRN